MFRLQPSLMLARSLFLLGLAILALALLALTLPALAADGKKDEAARARLGDVPASKRSTATKKTPSKSAPAKAASVKPTPGKTSAKAGADTAPPVKPAERSSKPVSDSSTAKLSASAGGDFGKFPTDITSQTLTLRADQRVFIYQGEVKVVHGDMTLLCETLEGTYSEKNEIEKLVAKGSVHITKVDIIATSERALYDAATATVTLTDNPKLEQNGSLLTADKIKLFLNEDRSTAEGTVRVKMLEKEGAKPVVPSSGAVVGAPPVSPPDQVGAPSKSSTESQRQN